MAALAPDIPAVELQIIEMTNAFRGQNALKAVKRNPLLDKAARAYAAYLGRTNQFAHDADGRKPAARAEAAGYASCDIAENLAMAMDSRGFAGPALAKQTVEGWMKSPGHRRNLLAPNVEEIGVAVVRAPDAKPKYITVQLFGLSKSRMITFQIKNVSESSVSYVFGGETHSIGPRYTIRHQSCRSGDITFQIAGDWFGWSKVESRHKAADGQTYVVGPDKNGGIGVSVGTGTAGKK